VEQDHPCEGCNSVVVTSILPFPSVFAFKEASGQPEISQRQRGENKVTLVCTRSSKVLQHPNTKTHTQARLNKRFDKGGDYVEKLVRVCIKFFFAPFC